MYKDSFPNRILFYANIADYRQITGYLRIYLVGMTESDHIIRFGA